MRSSGDNEAITDTVWCPGNASVFASVTESGKLLIWDLAVSSIDPVTLKYFTPKLSQLNPKIYPEIILPQNCHNLTQKCTPGCQL